MATIASVHLLFNDGDSAPPKDYHESFVRLGTLGVMTADLAKEMAMAAGLRNRIVHEYNDIDPERVYEALPVAVRQIPLYLDHIHRFVEKLPQR